jgi:sugar O-acyltransferase (sialic acid O-acetyltransferase NeuD family)
VRVVIAGAGGHAKVVCDALLASGAAIEVIGFSEDDARLVGGPLLGLPILQELEALQLDRSVRVALGIGGNTARRRYAVRVAKLGHGLLTVRHPSAIVGSGCVVGDGAVIFANVAVNAATQIGEGVILNTSCSVDHDCRIGAYAHIGPGARLAGGISVGEETLVGIGAVILPGIRVGSRSIVGAGAVVVSDIGSDCVAVGVPARSTKRRGDGTDG